MTERQVTGVVRAQLPSGLYEVEIDGPHQGTPSGRPAEAGRRASAGSSRRGATRPSGRHRVTAHIGGGVERNFVRLLVGDRVVVELAPRDASRGRVVRKL